MLKGVFLGYEQQAGGGWSEDVWIIDWEELEQAPSAHEVYHKRFKWKEVNPVKNGEKFRFPLARGDLKQPEPQVRHSGSKPRREQIEEYENDYLKENKKL